MLKNIISYIFIYIILVGCEPITYEEDEAECFINLTSDLYVENGYHILDYIEGGNQTFEYIHAEIGYGKDYELIGFTSNVEYCFEWNGTLNCSNLVNGSGYTDEYGIATTILGVYQEHIGDTIKVYGGYYDWYGTQYLDSLEVIVKWIN